MLSRLSDEVNYEPKLALDGGKDGLSIIRDIFLWEKNTNKNNAKKIVIEIDQNITLEVIDLARYIAICLGLATDLDLLGECISVILILKCSATFF